MIIEKGLFVMPMPFVPKDRTRSEHIGTVEGLVFNSPSKDFTILKLTDGATVLGMADGEAFTRGAAFRFLGRWEDDATRGPRFRFTTSVPHLMHGRVGVTAYLTKTCGGIGQRTADRLWSKYGGEAVEMLRSSPERVAAECGVSVETCRTASAELVDAKKYEATRIDLFSLTAGRGFSAKFIESAIEKWGVHAPRIIKRNPFAMLGLPSAGFKKCDKLWADLGLPKDSLKRAGLIAWNLVKAERNGHTWVAAADLADRLREVAPGCDAKRAFKFGLRARKLKKHTDSDGKVWLAAYHRATSEERIAAAVKRLVLSRCEWPTGRVPVSEAEGDKLPSEHQVERLKRATRLPVGLLLGGPGTGKSHVTAYLLREVIAEFGRSAVLACAPTGKAAVRMTQAFAAAGLDVTATTIHRTLEINRNGHDGDGWGFMRNRANPLDAKFVVADEASMDDCDLMADLLDAIPTGGHILFIGDPYQLPPVGHGAPLRDLIAAGVPHGELTEVRRNAGQIVHACVRIKNGESFEVADEVDLEASPPKNLKLIEARDEKAAADKLVETLQRMTRFHPVWQTQVIVARNKAGELSRKALNERLQPLLNPDGKNVAGNPFKVGDKLICTRNGRMHRVEPMGFRGQDESDAASYEVVRDIDNQPEEVYVANGEIGRVVAVAAKLTVARFSEAESLVKIPMGRERDSDEEDDGDGDSGRGCNFDHAYAVTCHRLQGSESPCIIVMADPQGGMIATREWWYTAISRASKLCIVVGQRSTIDKQRLKQSLVRRKTFLSDLAFDALTEGL